MRWIFAAAVLLQAGAASAHNFGFTDVRLELHADGTFRAEVLCDVDALALGVDSSADSAELAARIEAMPRAEQDALATGVADVLARRIRVRFDDAPGPFAVSLPERGTRPPGSQPSALGLVAQLDGRIPAGARTVSFFAARGPSRSSIAVRPAAPSRSSAPPPQRGR
jgi:hypothetical protein